MRSLGRAAIFALLVVPSVALAQGHDAHKMSDADIVKLATTAGPKAVTKDATIAVVENGAVRTVRKGTNGWTCLPGHGDPKNPDPMCGDANAMEWASAWMSKKEPPAGKVGFM